MRCYLGLGSVLVSQRRSWLVDEDLDSVISHILGYSKVGDPEKSEFPLFYARLSMFDIY